MRRGASAYVIKTVNPDDLPATLRQALEGNVHTAIGGEEGRAREREGPRAHGARADDPRRPRPRALERRDREGVLGRAADGEVPPHEHLPQARREEPHRGDAHRVPARARGEPDLRRRLTRAARSPHRRGGVHPHRPPGRVRPHLPADLPSRARRQRQLAQPHGRARGRGERPPEPGRDHGVRPRCDVDRPAVARAGLHVRRVQPRRLRAALDRDGDLRRRGVLHRRCRRAPARRRSARDLGDVPAGARRRAVGVVDPGADARAPPLHRPALAARLGGAETRRGGSGSRSRSSSSGRTSTAASLSARCS